MGAASRLYRFASRLKDSKNIQIKQLESNILNRQ
jgi:hypothetical protein